MLQNGSHEDAPVVIDLAKPKSADVDFVQASILDREAVLIRARARLRLKNFPVTQRLGRRHAIRGRVEDLRRLPTQMVNHSQRRHFLEQRVESLHLRRFQILRTPTKIVHQGSQLLSSLGRQSSFVHAVVFFRSASATSPNLLATWKRSSTA